VRTCQFETGLKLQSLTIKINRIQNPEANGGLKRPLEEKLNPDPKRTMSDGGLGALQNGNIIPNMAAPLTGGQRSEDISVPDKLVGLIIGRGGESISRLQAETGCKIQMAPDSNGVGDRGCTLTGTPESIQRCKDMIMSIITAHNAGVQNGAVMGGPPTFMGNPMGGGNTGGGGGGQVEIMVPKDKVGLVIGKGGETIKQLMERTGAKMFILQENSSPDADKPLRIMGDPHKVEMARQMVYDLMADKEMDGGGFGGRPKFSSPTGFGGPEAIQVPVHRSAVGVVIGKGGEMINRIQNETGARVQFQKDDENGPGEYRMCHLTGTPNQCQEARKRIEDLVESVMIRDRQSGRGRGSGPMPAGRFGGPPGNWDGYGPPMGGPMGPGGPGPRNGREPVTSTFVVPAHKCGIIIGKGGETIKWINMTAGAHCEIDKNPPPNANEKIFVIRGTVEQIDHAKRLMAEKLGIAPPPPTQFSGGPGGPGPQGGPPGQNFPAQNWGGNYPDFRQGQQPGNPPNDPNAAAWAAYYQQYYGQNAPQGAPAAPAAAQPQPTPTPTPASTGAQQDFTQQWIEYYRSMGMHKEAEMLEQHAKSQTRVNPAAQTAAQGPTAAPAAAAAAPAQGAGGQPDYSQQWIEYYKSIGKFKEAEAIEAQLKASQASTAAATGPYPNQPTGYPAGYGGSAAPQASYYGGQASAYPGYSVP